MLRPCHRPTAGTRGPARGVRIPAAERLTPTHHLELRDLREHELQLLTDEDLLAYLQLARKAGRVDLLKRALAVLVFGYMDNVTNRVRLKVPEEDVEDVAAVVLESAISSAFDGRSTGEFRAWLHRIVDRRVADYYRRREGKPKLMRLPTAHLGDEEAWGDEPAEDFSEAVDASRAFRQTYEELSDDHRNVVDLYVLGPCSAVEAAERIPGMTEANVHQIGSRFQKRFNQLLEGGDTSGGRS
jgi:RNA polymerase sigma factor (sigma-70 family)